MCMPATKGSKLRSTRTRIRSHHRFTSKQIAARRILKHYQSRGLTQTKQASEPTSPPPSIRLLVLYARQLVDVCISPSPTVLTTKMFWFSTFALPMGLSEDYRKQSAVAKSDDGRLLLQREKSLTVLSATCGARQPSHSFTSREGDM